MSVRTWFAVFALLLSLQSVASESRVTGTDVAEIRAVIHRQIDAFRRDDAHSAFALVSPGVQEAFGTPERFLDVVRTAYRAVYRPASVSDRAGGVWLAYYAMQRQQDGSWRTNGCHLVQPIRIISA